MNPVERVLSGRDGRAMLQKLMIERSGLVVQVSLNIPGFPKRLLNDRILVEEAANILKIKARSMGHKPVWSVLLENGAGCAELVEIPGAEGKAVKILGMEMEDRQWGSILDIDVIGRAGAVNRKELGGCERKCLICGAASKFCAREQRHDFELLRNRSALLLAMGLKEIYEGGRRHVTGKA
ncbi:MAG: citrate lyase holo-[acyl-carrier protein] synthase [Thermovirgaceae bacterium]|nr:citrate lyase holo-[acyl-carrier protein] synthase [Thermovirgaceae bacterium]